MTTATAYLLDRDRLGNAKSLPNYAPGWTFNGAGHHDEERRVVLPDGWTPNDEQPEVFDAAGNKVLIVGANNAALVVECMDSTRVALPWAR